MEKTKRKNRARLRLGGLLAAAALAAAVAAGSALGVVGGAPDGNAHPYVGALVYLPTGNPADGFELCSGSAVSPRVIVTAAHCFPGGASVHVSFDENARASNPATWPTGTVTNDPAACFGCGPGAQKNRQNDIAVVVLDEPVTLPRYAQLPSWGYDDTLPRRQQVEIVGYGLQEPPVGHSPQDSFGFRADGLSTILPGGGSNAGEFLKLSSNRGATCSGDSGGPDLQAGTDVVLAISSYGPSSTCNAVAYSQRVDTAHALEFVSGFLG